MKRKNYSKKKSHHFQNDNDDFIKPRKRQQKKKNEQRSKQDLYDSVENLDDLDDYYKNDNPDSYIEDEDY